MAVQEAPNSIDITDIQFKLHSKYQLFNANASTPDYNGIDLLATASTFGLVIVGKPSSCEIQVLRLQDAVENAETSNISVRSINIPGEPYVLALSCDHTMLAVCYTANRRSFMDIYAVQSFLSANVVCVLSKVSLSNCEGVKVKQILWNPVIPNTMAVCLNDGMLGAYTIKANSFEFNSLDKSENARCACWSPKGKQIVVAFPNGKLAQYKPDLKLAKTIPCTVQLLPPPFSPVAIQWLSTYQFAVVFVEDKEDAAQSLFIVNAPKSAPPSYINYYDITYSQTGPRSPQVFLIHILQWNLLLMASSNGTEIGILGTTEAGETPLWKQYTFIDEGRAELPLTTDKQDTFPIGLALETGCTHQLTIGETQIPVMPMLHILSTHGLLLSFDLLNFQPSRVDICSPPQPISDQSGMNLFRPIANEPRSTAAAPPPANNIQQQQQSFTTPAPPSFGNTTKFFSPPELQQSTNLTFSIPDTAATSTPAKPSLQMQPSLPQMQTTPKPSFSVAGTNTQPAKSAMANLFGAPPPTAASSTSIFGGGAAGGTGLFNLGGSKEPSKPFSAAALAIPANVQSTPVSGQQSQSNAANKASSEAIQPFLTVQPNYKPSPQPTKSASSSIASNSENDAILRKLIKEEIDAFDDEFRKALNRSRNIQTKICEKDELSKLIKSIDEMQEVTTQATESTESLKADVQSLRLTLYEMLAMQAEAQSKVEEYKKMGKSTEESMTVNQTHRRLVNKLQNLLAQNQSRYDVFSKQLDANWNAHLQHKRENDKARMRIPTLENVYQTLEKQHQILMKEKEKINKLKIKAGLRDSSPNKIKYSYSNTDNLKVNSLVDSVLSLTIGEQIKNERRPLNAKKTEALRKATLGSRNVNFIKPTRPDRKGLNSEVIIEKKLASAKAQKEKENKKRAEAELERARQEKIKQEELARHKELSKPPKPLVTTSMQPSFAAPQQMQSKPAAQPTQSMRPQQVVSTTTTTSKAKDGVEKQWTITTTKTPAGPSPSMNAGASKSFFGNTDKPQISFGFGAGTVEKSASDTSAPSSKAPSFDAPAATAVTTTTSSPFSFGGTKTDAPNMFGAAAAPSFSFGGSVQKSPSFSLISQSKSSENTLNLAKSSVANDSTTASVAPVPALTPAASGKIPLLLTPTATNKTPTLNPAAGSATGVTTKPTITAAKSATPTATQPLSSQQSTPNVPTATKTLLATPVPTTNAPTAAASTFKFDLGIQDSSSKSAPDNKENSAPQTTSKASAIGTFSFALGNSNATQLQSGLESTPKSVAPAAATTLATALATSPSTTAATVTATLASVPSSTPSSSIGFSFAKASAESSLFGGNTTITPASTNATAPSATTASSAAVSSSSDPSNIFQSFNICKPNTADSSNTNKGLFGSASFGALAANASSPTNSPASIFGGASANSVQPTNLFGDKSNANNASTMSTATTTASIFGTSSVSTTSPPQSTNIFGGAAINSPVSGGNLFGTPTSAKPLFGGGATSTAPSLFGGASSPAQNSFGATSSPFGNANTTPAASVFGGATATPTNNAAQATSIFGGSAAVSPTSGGSLFGGTASFGSPQPSTAGSVFGSSAFGGGGFAQTPTTSASVFGNSFSTSTASPFGGGGATAASPPAFGGSTFGQAAQSPTQTGFGSPQQQSGFGLSALAASANPTFGSGATFGTGATFGSPKGFGTFGSMSQANAAFSSPPQKNTLFESLGSSENAMTFGNLAQNQASPTPAAPKPFGGGSSFSSWR